MKEFSNSSISSKWITMDIMPSLQRVQRYVLFLLIEKCVLGEFLKQKRPFLRYLVALFPNEY